MCDTRVHWVLFLCLINEVRLKKERALSRRKSAVESMGGLLSSLQGRRGSCE